MVHYRVNNKGEIMTPEELGLLADQYIVANQKRILADKAAKEAASVEHALKQQLIEELGELRAIGGALGVINRNPVQEPHAKDWPSVWKYIRENDAFELLHKRLTKAALEERQQQGEEVPGVEWVTVQKLSISKKVK